MGGKVFASISYNPQVEQHELQNAPVNCSCL